MRKMSIVIACCLLLLGCKQKAKKILDKAFTPVNVERVYYEFENDRLVSETRTNSSYAGGLIGYRIKITSKYLYDEKFRLTKKTSKMTIDSLVSGKKQNGSSDITIYRYDNRDSVIEILTTEQNGDTSYWEVYDFFPDGKQVIKGITLKFDDYHKTVEELVESQHNQYYTNKYFYVKGLCRKIEEYDDNGKLTSMTLKDYTTQRPFLPVKSTNLYYEPDTNPLFDSVMPRKEIEFNSYEKSIAKPDICLLDERGDTLRQEVWTFNSSGQTIKRKIIDNRGRCIIVSLFEDDKLKQEIFANWQSENMSKMVKDYTYYPNGRLKEVRTK